MENRYLGGLLFCTLMHRSCFGMTAAIQLWGLLYQVTHNCGHTQYNKAPTDQTELVFPRVGSLVPFPKAMAARLMAASCTTPSAFLWIPRHDLGTPRLVSSRPLITTAKAQPWQEPLFSGWLGGRRQRAVSSGWTRFSRAPVQTQTSQSSCFLLYFIYICQINMPKKTQTVKIRSREKK